MKIEIYKSGFLRLSWKWRLLNEDANIIAYGRGFNRKQNAEKSIEAIKRFFRKGNVPKIYESGRTVSSWKWRITATNGRILASDKGFSTKEKCEESFNEVKTYFYSLIQK